MEEFKEYRHDPAVQTLFSMDEKMEKKGGGGFNPFFLTIYPDRGTTTTKPTIRNMMRASASRNNNVFCHICPQNLTRNASTKKKANQ